MLPTIAQDVEVLNMSINISFGSSEESRIFPQEVYELFFTNLQSRKIKKEFF